ncbi:MAG: nuclear transport factor 2 family protein [Thermomicrobiales bacterium]
MDFDALPPLAWSGLAALREKLGEWFSGYDGPIGYTLQALQGIANREIGFALDLYSVTGSLKDGTAVEMWVRSTAGLVKEDGSWLITHEYTSVPSDPASGKALLSLKPGAGAA